eukprot:TRINITY_DN103407_c0_g1_i1.p1 TRINITY_DN103407_c0_g1~~TRINITY_DN103407_c0_g1_i1.p1  ORF type:complete len:209 (+),score=53.12 TRINITY_DN103407_c0_g1_i1:117-743(+)
MASLPISLKFVGQAASQAVNTAAARAGLSPCASPRAAGALLQLPLSPRTPKTPNACGPKTPPVTPLVNLVQMAAAPFVGDMSPTLMSPTLRKAMECNSCVSPTLRLAAARLSAASEAAERTEQSTPSMSPQAPEKPARRALPKLLGSVRSLQQEPANTATTSEGARETATTTTKRVHFDGTDAHKQAHENFLERQRQRAERRAGNFVI